MRVFTVARSSGGGGGGVGVWHDGYVGKVDGSLTGGRGGSQ